jgi:hypothetical protein
MGETYHNFRFSERNIFQARTGNPNQHDSTQEIGFLAQAISRRRGPDERGDSVRIDQTDLPGQISRLAVDWPALAISPFTPSLELRNDRDADVRRR